MRAPIAKAAKRDSDNMVIEIYIINLFNQQRIHYIIMKCFLYKEKACYLLLILTDIVSIIMKIING